MTTYEMVCGGAFEDLTDEEMQSFDGGFFWTITTTTITLTTTLIPASQAW